jgi:hypothetical protein
MNPEEMIHTSFKLKMGAIEPSAGAQRVTLSPTCSPKRQVCESISMQRGTSAPPPDGYPSCRRPGWNSRILEPWAITRRTRRPAAGEASRSAAVALATAKGPLDNRPHCQSAHHGVPTARGRQRCLGGCGR